jgi:hypothetical protein
MSEHVAEGRNRLANYLTTAEVADRYRTAPATVRYWRHIGYGPKSMKVGRRCLYSEAELEKFDNELAQAAIGGAVA